MYILGGAIAGLAWGFLVGFLKYASLWRRTVRSKEKIYKEALYLRLGIGYGINVLTLLFVFLMRDIMPCDFAAAMIATAVGLSVSGKLAPMTQVVDCMEEVKE